MSVDISFSLVNIVDYTLSAPNFSLSPSFRSFAHSFVKLALSDSTSSIIEIREREQYMRVRTFTYPNTILINWRIDRDHNGRAIT